MVDEKNHLGDKLHKKEKAEEDHFIREREEALLARLRQQKATATHAEVRELTRDRCPKCGERMVPVKQLGARVEECPGGHGMWIDKGELQTIAGRERDSWLGRFFYRPKL